MSKRMVVTGALVLVGVVAVGALFVEDDRQPEPRSPDRSGPTAHERREKLREDRAQRRAQRVEVPDLVGLDLPSAEAQLRKRGFRMVARTLTVLEGISPAPGDECLDAAPGSRVASQYPEPGTRENPNVRVELRPSEYVQVGCSPRGAPPACTADELELHLGRTTLPDYGGGAADAGAAVVHLMVEHVRPGSACRLDETLQVSIEDPSGRLATDVAGNPGIIRLHSVLRPGGELFAHWFWKSWCGPRNQVNIAATVAGLSNNRRLSATREHMVVPPCRGASSLYPYDFSLRNG